jgi:hypothetical protein
MADAKRYRTRGSSRLQRGTRLLIAGAILLCGAQSHGQELEPGAYAIAPVGLNLAVLTNTLSIGDVGFDPSGPIEDARATINVTTLGYGRAVNVMGRSGTLGVGVPIVAGHINGRYLGEFAEVGRLGPGDPRVRLGVNLYGAPAMDVKAFAAHRAKRLLGVSLSVAMPLGQYSSDRLINIGTDRWAFKPEIGFVHAARRWSIETYGGVWLFTTNHSFYRGSVRTQQPIASLQFHVHFRVTPRLELSTNANFYTGGRTTVNGRTNLDLQRNSRVGVTMVQALSTRHALRVAVSQGAYTTIGADFTSIAVGLQRTWVPRPR